MSWWIAVPVVAIVLIVAWDVFQKDHAILRNFPLIGHFRYLLESVGPELRQYIVTDNDEERPFTRDQRRWVYASAKRENNLFGFGTDNDLEGSEHYLVIKQAAFPWPEPSEPDPLHPLPCAKVVGEPRGRRHAFRPRSIVNVSGMSFGSLSGRAVEAMNIGCREAQCLHDTGEGAISDHHRHGGELLWQIGTGYFGARDLDGRLSIEKIEEVVARDPVRAISLKLSQGAKPGKGGILPGVKVTEEIARVRGVRPHVDCASPSGHSAFRDVDSMLDVVEEIAERTGLPVGIKSAVGDDGFWRELARLMESGERGVDFIQVDGGEGGTGAAPLTWSDHVAMPFLLGFSRVYRAFAERGLHERVTFVGSGRLGLPDRALMAFALGCDLVHVGRTAMLAVGCIQAQRCHTGHCPTGVATQNPWLARGLEPRGKGERLFNYLVTLRKELGQLAHTCGVAHPALVTADQLEVLDGAFGARTLREAFRLEEGWGLPSTPDRDRLLQEVGAVGGELRSEEP